MVIKENKKKQLKKETLKAAEDVCWTVLLLMAFGGLDLPDDECEILRKPMQKWADLSDEYDALVADGD